MLRNIFENALKVLSESHEVVRLRTYEALILDDAVPILQACSKIEKEQRPSNRWIKSCSKRFGYLLRDLQNARVEAEGGNV